ncbi:PREDICTED: ATP-binding cassette sub-family B member 10, mitochondrial-like [Priapulus caudatus]|uniref:ATP-binding cassette sub-family B member 10, mitochondrial-like n=1 Tax=Priapulus caudatus TaxID=37621 RepID=A0ABM1E3W2_PRICU|nr:PREDICTED: ATP-binding cassette sub-family B member 10, mitochondrial-like [Priapulus caudatus]
MGFWRIRHVIVNAMLFLSSAVSAIPRRTFVLFSGLRMHTSLKRTPSMLSVKLSRQLCMRFGQNKLLVALSSNKLLKRGRLAEPKAGDDGIKKGALSKGELNSLISLAGPDKWAISWGIGGLLVSSTVAMAVPFCVGKVIDIIYTNPGDPEMLQQLTSFVRYLCLALAVGASGNFIRAYMLSTAGHRIVKRLREDIFGSIVRQEIAFFDRTKTGELINRLSTDTFLVGQSITQNVSDGLRSFTSILAGIGMMMYVSPHLAGISLGVVSPVMLLGIGYGRFVRNITKETQDALAEATNVAEERISNIRTVRAFAQEIREEKQYEQQLGVALKLYYKESLYRSIFYAFAGLSGNGIIVAVLYAGGMLTSSELITVGQLSSFMLYAAWVGLAIGGLSSFYSELMRGIGASTRLFEIRDRQSHIPLDSGIIPSKPLLGELVFEDVNFKYPSREHATVFHHMSLIIPAGSVMAIVGSSGSGKSTLASLLLRFYEADEGRIAIDNEDVKNLNPSWLRRHIGVVSQEPILFSTSIAENIAYGSQTPESVTMVDIIEAAKQANAFNFVTGFPNGFDTMVGERGLMLSGGQRQRIAIARAIITNPKILILDEATSALDAESEYLVQEALERLMTDRTTLIIAHRLSTIRSADKIAVLESGRVAELGTYQELIDIPDGIFHKLVERQTLVEKN